MRTTSLLLLALLPASIALAQTHGTRGPTEEKPIGPPSFRMARSPQQKAICGSRLLKFAAAHCKRITPGTNIDIATKCCTEMCDPAFIRSALCPNE